MIIKLAITLVIEKVRCALAVEMCRCNLTFDWLEGLEPSASAGKGPAAVLTTRNFTYVLVLTSFLLLFSSFGFGQTCPGGTAGCVQANSSSSGGAQTASVTLTNSVVAGDTIAVGVSWASTSVTLSGITASGGCTVSGGFVLPAPANGSNPSQYSTAATAAIAYGIVTTGGPCTVSANLSSPVPSEFLTVQELNVGPYDCSSMNHQDSPGTGLNAVTSLNCTTSKNGDYLLGEYFDLGGNGGTWTPGTGFVAEANSGAEGSETEDGVQTSSGSAAATFTTSVGWSHPTTGLMAFQPVLSGQANFTLTASPTSVTIPQGNVGTSTLTTGISSGFNGSISLSASGMPSGVTTSFTPQTIPAPGSGTSTLTLTVGSSTAAGNYPITITGNGGGIQQTATVTLTVTSGQSTPWSGILNSTRAENWAAGQVGTTITNRTTICATPALAAGSGSAAANATAINRAIASCPSGQVVSIPAGTWYVNGVTDSGVSNITIRGAGPTQTDLIFLGGSSCGGNGGDFCLITATPFYAGSTQVQPGGSNAATWSAGFSQGNTSITLTNVGSAGLSVGQVIVLDQANDGATNGYGGDTGGVFICDYYNSSSQSCQQYGTGNANGRVINGATHSQVQMVTVTAWNPATGVATISPGLYANNWRSSQNPGAWWMSSITGVGIENMTVDHTSSSSEAGIYLYGCNGCWVDNVRDIDSVRDHVWLMISNHDVVRDSYFYKTQSEASSSYGVEFAISSDDLVENNIFQQVASPIIFSAGSGIVLGYNFSRNNAYVPSNNWMQIAYTSHNAGSSFNLWEGNDLNGIGCDDGWGTSDLSTYFRNWITGRDYNNTTLTSLSTQPISLAAGCRGYNILGNVLGTPGYHNQYEAYPPSTGTANCDTTIYQLGWAGAECGSISTPNVPNDTLVRGTMMRWGNYDVANGAVRWDSTESSPPAVPYIGAQTTPANHSLPSSFYLTATPGFFATPQGSLPFPPSGPDVTGGTGPGGHAYLNPASNCYYNVMSGPSDGTGAVLSFDANSCYYSQVPAPPNNLVASPQ